MANQLNVFRALLDSKKELDEQIKNGAKFIWKVRNEGMKKGKLALHSELGLNKTEKEQKFKYTLD